VSGRQENNTNGIKSAGLMREKPRNVCWRRRGEQEGEPRTISSKLLRALPCLELAGGDKALFLSDRNREGGVKRPRVKHF